MQLSVSNPLFQRIKLMQQGQSEPLQLAKCVVKDANLHVSNCNYWYNNLQFHELS